MTAGSSGNPEGPCVSLDLESRPEALTLVRAMLSGAGELFAIDAELLDDLKTAVSEACNNVVLHAYPDGNGPLSVELYVLDDALTVCVCDTGRGIESADLEADHRTGVGMSLINALAHRADFSSAADGGTEVFMSFSAIRDGQRLFIPSPATIPSDGWTSQLYGDAVASVSPVNLLGTLLGRLTRAVAATARFSLDRFSDVYLVTDAVAAHAATATDSDRIAFAITAKGKQLELSVGPLREGSGEQIRLDGERQAQPSPLTMLSDQLDIDSLPDQAEVLRIVMVDHAG